MFLWFFLVVAVLNIINNLVCYDPQSKANGLIWVGLSTAIIANSLWIWLAKNTPESTRLMFYAMSWDFVTTTCSIAIPVFVFGARLSAIGWVGMTMAIVGLSIVRFTMGQQ